MEVSPLDALADTGFRYDEQKSVYPDSAYVGVLERVKERVLSHLSLGSNGAMYSAAPTMIRTGHDIRLFES